MAETKVFITRDGVDITRLVRLHRRYHGMPVSCAVRRLRGEKATKRQELSFSSTKGQHGRGPEPQGDPHQRGWVLAQV